MADVIPDEELGRLIFDVMSAIEELNSHRPDDARSEDLSTGTVRASESQGDERRFTISLITSVLEIRENNRDNDVGTTHVVVRIDNEIVCDAMLHYVLEDENEFLYTGCTRKDLKQGPWIDELRMSKKRLDLLIGAQKANLEASNQMQREKKLAKKLLRRRNSTP